MAVAPTTAMASLPTLCAATVLPANAVLQFGIERVTLTQEAMYQAPCPTIAARAVAYTSSVSDSSLSASDDDDDRSHQFSDFRDPFYATQFPMCYALAATTVTAYMLVIMLFVTPRSFVDGGTLHLGRRGFSSGSSRGVSIGGRPWLQKLAALTVAISLTVATADTFRVAEKQYAWGIQNASQMQREVIGSTEIKIIRIVSDTFLWLAQAQTLIRLFPRQREKIIIKWAAFALITLDVIFTALNSFQYSVDGVSGPQPPNSFAHPVPALSYLFQLALGILYAVWVLYYALTKKRYAFYHPLMKNMCLIAVIGVASVLIPVVFFILDISKPGFTGWGDYVRWVGAAAASVVVWEWVERIEALEREEKKDGILGREVFDGDDTLEVNASDFPWLRQLKSARGGSGGDGGGDHTSHTPNGHAWGGLATDPGRRDGGQPGQGGGDGNPPQQRLSMGNILRPHIWPSRPAPVATPVSRTDTGSAASTVYAVRYPPPSDTTNRTPDPITQATAMEMPGQGTAPRSQARDGDGSPSQAPGSTTHSSQAAVSTRRSIEAEANGNGWATTSNRGSFVPTAYQDGNNGSDERSRDLEKQAMEQQSSLSPGRSRSSGSRWDVRARLEVFAANQAERIRERIRPTTDTGSLPVTVVPAPPRRGAALQQVLEEEELAGNSEDSGGRGDSHGSGSRSRDGSEDMARLDRSRSGLSGNSLGPDGLPPGQPPLWPGVQSRLMYEDDGYSSFDEASVTDTSSLDDEQRDTETAPGASVTPRPP